MAIYTTYATNADLATYLGVVVGDLPSDSQRLLNRANELVKQITLSNIDETNENHMEAAKLAVCAQVEYWQSMGETTALSGDVKSFSIGNFSVDYGGGGGSGSSSNTNQVASRTRNYLNQQGLLYRGVRMSDTTNLSDDSN